MKTDLTKRKEELEKEIKNAVKKFIDDTDLMNLECNINTETGETKDTKNLIDINVDLSIFL